jgi:hypothetical protein
MPRKLTKPQFVICVRNNGFPAALEPCKVYRVVADPEAASHRMMRVIDESGEDYLYPRDRFVAIELPRAAAVIVPRKSRSVARAKA